MPSLHEQEDVIEKSINMGQLEELIEQAEDELSVIPVYLGASLSCSLSLSVRCCPHALSSRPHAAEHKLWEPPVSA